MQNRNENIVVKALRTVANLPEKLALFLKNSKFLNYIATSESKEVDKSKFSVAIEKFFINLNRKISGFINGNFIYKLFKYLLKTLFTCRLVVYGIFLISFAIVAAFSTALKTPTIYAEYDMFSFYVSIALAIISIPFLVSKNTFASFLVKTKQGSKIANNFGVVVDEETAEIKSGKAYVAIILAVCLGALSFLFTPLDVFLVFIQAIITLIVLKTPEIGILVFAVSLVFCDLKNIVVVVAITFISYLLKFIRGKRVYKLAKIDAFVLLFMFATILNIFVNHQAISVDLVFKYLLLILVYFIVSVNTTRFLITLVDSSISTVTFLMSIFIILGKVQTLIVNKVITTSPIVYETTLKTASFFKNYEDYIAVVVILFPIVFAKLIAAKRNPKKAFIAVLCMIVSILAIFTEWNLLNWYVVILSILVVLIFVNKKMIYALIVGAAGLPILYGQFESKIVSFVSNNMPEFYSITSSASNASIVKNTFNILKDYWFVGIGFDESVWKYIYSMYSEHLSSIPNSSNNLYLQIFTTYGLVGIILFVIVLLYVLYATVAYLFNFSKYKSNVYVYMDEKDLDVENIDLKAHYTNRQIDVVAPFISLCIYLVFGFSSYMWWDFQFVALFWMIIGLISSNCKSGLNQIKSIERVEEVEATSEFEGSVDLKYRTNKNRR